MLPIAAGDVYMKLVNGARTGLVVCKSARIQHPSTGHRNGNQSASVCFIHIPVPARASSGQRQRSVIEERQRLLSQRGRLPANARRLILPPCSRNNHVQFGIPDRAGALMGPYFNEDTSEASLFVVGKYFMPW